MGGVVSSGVDNDDLINKLKVANYIEEPCIERVFRLVDRGHYFTKEDQMAAYSDNAWKLGKLHLSAPCIYAKVMEGLQLKEGMSFLNLGSGTGYLSTVAGFLLGAKGINHGIEYHSDVVTYANERLAVMMSDSGAIDVASFCVPQFVQGNALSLRDDVMLYDRVYCGASCPQSHDSYMKNILKIGGVLVMPRDDSLLKVTRNSENDWTVVKLLSVTFSPFCFPDANLAEESLPPPVNVPSLQELTRELIRSIFRTQMEKENESLLNSFIRTIPASESTRASRKMRNYFPPLPLSEDESDIVGDDIRTANHILAFINLARSSETVDDEDDDDEEETNESNNEDAMEQLEETMDQEAIELVREINSEILNFRLIRRTGAVSSENNNSDSLPNNEQSSNMTNETEPIDATMEGEDDPEIFADEEVKPSGSKTFVNSSEPETTENLTARQLIKAALSGECLDKEENNFYQLKGNNSSVTEISSPLITVDPAPDDSIEDLQETKLEKTFSSDEESVADDNEECNKKDCDISSKESTVATSSPSTSSRNTNLNYRKAALLSALERKKRIICDTYNSLSKACTSTEAGEGDEGTGTSSNSPKNKYLETESENVAAEAQNDEDSMTSDFTTSSDSSDSSLSSDSAGHDYLKNIDYYRCKANSHKRKRKGRSKRRRRVAPVWEDPSKIYTKFMKEKINQLTLPSAIKLYLNNNRPL